MGSWKALKNRHFTPEQQAEIRAEAHQELALAASLHVGELDDTLIVAFATDGTDGPTDAAGAVADGTTLDRARAAGLDAQVALARNDAYPFFARLDDLLLTGPTNTNVNDLILVLAR